jgi:hypothetical protein
MPIEVHIILDFHFFTLSSSFEEKRSLMTPIIKNKPAIIIKKFFIWKAIVVNASITPSDHPELGAKKNQRTGPIKESSVSLFVDFSLICTSRRLLSIAKVAPIL